MEWVFLSVAFFGGSGTGPRTPSLAIATITDPNAPAKSNFLLHTIFALQILSIALCLLSL